MVDATADCSSTALKLGVLIGYGSAGFENCWIWIYGPRNWFYNPKLSAPQVAMHLNRHLFQWQRHCNARWQILRVAPELAPKQLSPTLCSERNYNTRLFHQNMDVIGLDQEQIDRFCGRLRHPVTPDNWRCQLVTSSGILSQHHSESIDRKSCLCWHETQQLLLCLINRHHSMMMMMMMMMTVVVVVIIIVEKVANNVLLLSEATHDVFSISLPTFRQFSVKFAKLSWLVLRVKWSGPSCSIVRNI